MGRPGRCTSDADIIVVTPPCIELSIQPIIPCRGVQSPKTTCACESISPGTANPPSASSKTSAGSSLPPIAYDDAVLAAQPIDLTRRLAELGLPPMFGLAISLRTKVINTSKVLSHHPLGGWPSRNRVASGT